MQRRKEIILENLFRKFIEEIARPNICHTFKLKQFADWLSTNARHLKIKQIADWLSTNASHLKIKQINLMMQRDCIRDLGGDVYLYDQEADSE